MDNIFEQRGYGALRFTPFDADQVADLRGFMMHVGKMLRVDAETESLRFDHEGMEDPRGNLLSLAPDVRSLVEHAAAAGVVVSGEMHCVGASDAEMVSVDKNVVSSHQGQIMVRYTNGVTLPLGY